MNNWKYSMKIRSATYGCAMLVERCIISSTKSVAHMGDISSLLYESGLSGVSVSLTLILKHQIHPSDPKNRLLLLK